MRCLRILCLFCFSACAVGFKKGGNSILAKKQQKVMDIEVDRLLQRWNKLASNELENQGEIDSEDKKQFSNLRDSVVRSTDQNYTQILTVNNGGAWGGWGDAEFCAEGSYAVGYELQIEKPQGGGDDTALNSIRLLCEFPDGGCGGSPTSTEGSWGNWTGYSTCGSNRVLTAFKLQVEESRGSGDDTAANFVQFKCRDLGGSMRENVFAVSPGRGSWGSFGSWSESCPPGQAICGLQTRVEASCGGTCDDTALNNVRFYCCD